MLFALFIHVGEVHGVGHHVRAAGIRGEVKTVQLAFPDVKADFFVFDPYGLAFHDMVQFRAGADRFCVLCADQVKCFRKGNRNDEFTFRGDAFRIHGNIHAEEACLGVDSGFISLFICNSVFSNSFLNTEDRSSFADIRFPEGYRFRGNLRGLNRLFVCRILQDDLIFHAVGVRHRQDGLLEIGQRGHIQVFFADGNRFSVRFIGADRNIDFVDTEDIGQQGGIADVREGVFIYRLRRLFRRRFRRRVLQDDTVRNTFNIGYRQDGFVKICQCRQ